MRSWEPFVLFPSRLPSMTRFLSHLEAAARYQDNILDPVLAQEPVCDGPMRPGHMQQKVWRSLMEAQRVGHEQAQSEW